MKNTASKIGNYLWPSAGKSTHARIVDCLGWRITRVIVWPILAGIAVVIFAFVTSPAVMHSDYIDGIQVVEVQ